MGANVNIFEARIQIKGDKPIRWYPWKDAVEYMKDTFTVYIERRTRKQALVEAKKKGKVLSCRKIDRDKLFGDIGQLQIDNSRYMGKENYANAIAMDEMIWTKKKKRERIKNIHKDKKDIDI